jgi:hypothetical protein
MVGMVAASGATAPVISRMVRRRWTRVGTVAFATHLLYELAAGVGLPLASRIGPLPAATLYAGGSVVAFRQAGRQPHRHDKAFALLNGIYLAAVIAHFAAWPTVTRRGLPWLTECEGLAGRLMPPYNVILYLSGIAALGGLYENRNGAGVTAAFPVAMVPWLMKEQRRELVRLRTSAQQDPAWWNRRLQR